MESSHTRTLGNGASLFSNSANRTGSSPTTRV